MFGYDLIPEQKIYKLSFSNIFMPNLIAYLDSHRTDELVLAGSRFELPPKTKPKDYSNGVENLAKTITEKRTASGFDENQVIYFKELRE